MWNHAKNQSDTLIEKQNSRKFQWPVNECFQNVPIQMLCCFLNILVMFLTCLQFPTLNIKRRKSFLLSCWILTLCNCGQKVSNQHYWHSSIKSFLGKFFFGWNDSINQIWRHKLANRNYNPHFLQSVKETQMIFSTAKTTNIQIYICKTTFICDSYFALHVFVQTWRCGQNLYEM